MKEDRGLKEDRDLGGGQRPSRVDIPRLGFLSVPKLNPRIDPSRLAKVIV